MNDLIKEKKAMYKECNVFLTEANAEIKDIKDEFKQIKDFYDLFHFLYNEGLDHGFDIPEFLMKYFVNKPRN